MPTIFGTSGLILDDSHESFPVICDKVREHIGGIFYYSFMQNILESLISLGCQRQNMVVFTEPFLCGFLCMLVVVVLLDNLPMTKTYQIPS